MSIRELMDDLRARDVRLEADGLTLHVNAPDEAVTDELRITLREHKRALIRHLERERQRLEAADRRGLIIRWAKTPDYIALHDPTTGDWHEVRTPECSPWVVDDAKANRRSERRAG